MKIWAVVPAKPLQSAKSRLAVILTPQQRADLVVRMLERTLDVLAGWDALEGVLLVSADPKIWQIGIRHGVDLLAEQDTPGLNLSLERGRAEVLRRQGEAMLVVAGDLPFLYRRSLTEVLLSAPPPPCVVIAADQHGTGTNAILLAPADAIPFHFGPQSLQKHTQAARESGAACVQVNSPFLGFDVDQPEDLHGLAHLGIKLDV
jgi:2-phospho-L-lactate/phosphoenolpyruvate guanylyltransferase